MPEMVDIIPPPNDLVVALNTITKFVVSGGQTTYDPNELQSIPGTSFIWDDPKQILLLSKRCEVYRAVKRKVLWSYTTEEKGTEEWPITSEFEGIANDACIEFCNTRGIIPDLRKCINEAKVIFSNRQSLVAEYDCFPADEYEEEGHIVIRVEVDSDQDTAFREYDKFVGWMLDEIADDNLDFFVLTVNRVK